MSPNDISTIEFLDQLLDAGVHTLKLEGRGRSPEYVKLVTRAYRKAVNAVFDDTYSPEFVATLLDDINKVYNRGLSDGYYLGREQGWSKAYGSKATHQKVLLGHVSHYYAKIGVAEIKAVGKVEVGDEFLIIGETSGVIEGKIETMRLDEGETNEVKAGDVFAIKVSDRVRRNDKFFLVKAAIPQTSGSS